MYNVNRSLLAITLAAEQYLERGLTESPYEFEDLLPELQSVSISIQEAQ